MAIEKQKLMILVGPVEQFDPTAQKALQSGVFQPELYSKVGMQTTLHAMEDHNAYADTLQTIQKALDFAGITPEYRDFSEYHETDEVLSSSLSDFEERLNMLRKSIDEQEAVQKEADFLMQQLQPLQSLDMNLDDLFSFRFIALRFGRMPRPAYEKTQQLGLPENTFFIPTNENKNTVWGFYFCPRAKRDKVDAYFSALFFERERISEKVHGVPAQTLQTLTAQKKEAQEHLALLYGEYEKIIADNREHLLIAYSHYHFLSEASGMRKFAGANHHLFYLCGWVPARKAKSFVASLSSLEDVTVMAEGAEQNKNLQPPTKIHNPWGIRFFEQFVNMYGTPCYNELDPTPLVAISYTVFFGVMFGDVGQGIVLSLIGLLAYFKMKMPLGKIMTIIGLSSTAFGFVYGSVFGNEEWIRGVGFHVLEGNNTVMTLLAAAGVGILLIVGAMVLNIINGIKQRDFRKIFFDTNALAGLMLFGGNVAALLLTFLAGKKVYSPLFVIFFVVLPILAIFFREPLGKLCAGEADWRPKKFGEYCTENIFELFEVFLSFLSNTISYVRIGAFAISHAGMMLVVVSMSEMLGGTGGIIVMVLGNILVIGLEGLIVGIQGLRLQFYELFSRFYSGEGKPYHPMKVQF